MTETATEVQVGEEVVGWDRAASIAKRHPSWLRRAHASGILPARREGNAYVFLLKDLESLPLPQTPCRKVFPEQSVKSAELQIQVQALLARRADLLREIADLRENLALLVNNVLGPRTTPALTAANAAEYKRMARLLLDPGRQIPDLALQALGISPNIRSNPSEQAARALAGFVLPILGFETILSQTAHPDIVCVFRGQVVGVEVELSLANYNEHGHDAAHAHVVACWNEPNLEQLEQTDHGLMFKAKKCADGFSPWLAVVSLQTVTLMGDPLNVGVKDVSKFKQ